MSTAPTIVVVPDPPALAHAVAEHVVACATTAIRARGQCLLALAGGTTPSAAYAALASEAFRHQLDWSRLQVVWGDERCVPPDDPRSNYRMAREALLDHVPLKPANIHRIAGEVDPAQAASEYESQLRSLVGLGAPDVDAGLDLVLLGMGSDGHTASLFPGKAAVRERVRWVMAEFIEAVGMWRVTLTPVAINASRQVSFVVSGAAKARRLQEVLEGPRVPDRLPAQSVRPTHGRLTWLVDEAAATHLEVP